MSRKELPAFVRRLPAALLLGVAVYYAVWGGEYSSFDLGRLHDQRETAAEGLAASTVQVDSLGALAKRLEGDRATIEAVARERFGMVKEGELLYRFVPVEPATPSAEVRVTARTP
jgi:cell division protein FtsB